MRQSLGRLGLASVLGVAGCNLIADIQEGQLIGTTSGTAGTMTEGGSGGTTTTTTGGTAGGQGGGMGCQPMADQCAMCAFDACKDLYCACSEDEGCAVLAACIGVCDAGDTVCIHPCLASHEGSISTVFLLNGCEANRCAGGCPDAALLTPCAQCLFENCPMQMNTCLADADCYDILQCSFECPSNDFNCKLGCTNGKPQQATNKALAVQQCSTDSTSCNAACGG